MIDSDIDSAVCVQRGVALLLEDYANRRDFERDLGIPADAISAPAKMAAERHADLRKERDETKVGRMQVPKMTARFGHYALVEAGTGRAIYRLLSAHAHGKQWKGVTAKYEVVKDAVAVEGGFTVKVSPNDDMSVWLSAWAMSVATVALGELERHCGLRS